MYLTQSDIANDESMRSRIAQCAAENGCAAVAGIPPDVWMVEWRHVWAAAPGWDEAWESAIAGGILEPGKDPAVITDAQINSQVQSMMPFTLVFEHRIPKPSPSKK